jgi:hypothetical protein
VSLSVEQLLAVVQQYWRDDKVYHFRSENSSENERRGALWEKELKKLEQWWAFLDELKRELPGFTLGDATATCDVCFRCAAYSPTNLQKPPLRWAVVGCVSILAPVYTVYGAQSEHGPTGRIDRALFEPLPPEMRGPADVIARRIEATFGVSALPRELAETPVPLIVDPKEPPDTTLFHALFTSQPESIP